MKYYTLKSRCCPCFCGGEGEISFIVCANCDFLLHKCEEIDTLMTLDFTEIMNCPQCKEPYFCQFPYATQDQILALGFLTNELQVWEWE